MRIVAAMQESYSGRIYFIALAFFVVVATYTKFPVGHIQILILELYNMKNIFGVLEWYPPKPAETTSTNRHLGHFTHHPPIVT